MSKKDQNFYDSILNDIVKAKESGDHTTALKLIEEELSMPYVPKDVLQKLISIRAELLYESRSNNYAHAPTKDELLDMLSSENPAIVVDAIAMLADYSITTDMYQDFKNIFIRDDLPSIFKVFILQTLIEKNIDYEFVVNLNETVVVNPVKSHMIGELPSYIDIELEIDKLTMKNPSATQICKQLLTYFFLQIFPSNGSIYGVEATANSIVNFAKYMLGELEELDDEDNIVIVLQKAFKQLGEVDPGLTADL